MIFYQSERATLHCGDALSELRGMADNSVSMCVTSPPYWGLRAYGTDPQVWPAAGSDPNCDHEWGEEIAAEAMTGGPSATPNAEHGKLPTFYRAGPTQSAFCQRCGAWRGELGLEPSFDLFLAHLVSIFDEVKRVLHPSGVMFVNMGDSYASAGGHGGQGATSQRNGRKNIAEQNRGSYSSVGGKIKEKDLVGQPWALAFALRDAGWWLRDSIIWSKPSAGTPSLSSRAPGTGSRAPRCSGDAPAFARSGAQPGKAGLPGCEGYPHTPRLRAGHCGAFTRNPSGPGAARRGRRAPRGRELSRSSSRLHNDQHEHAPEGSEFCGR